MNKHCRNDDCARPCLPCSPPLAAGGVRDHRTRRYSSLPPSPQPSPRPATADPTGPTVPGTTVPVPRPLPQLSPEQYADVLDRIRTGMRCPTCSISPIDREIELYRSRARFPRPHVQARRALPPLHRHRDREAATCRSSSRCCRSSKARSTRWPIRAARASGLWQFMPILRASITASSRTGGSTSVATSSRRPALRSPTCSTSTTISAATGSSRSRPTTAAKAPSARGAAQPCSGPAHGSLQPRAAAETRDYVPKLLAISRIVRSPEAYGLQFAAIPNVPYFDIVEPGPPGAPGRRRGVAGISRDDMFALNPGYNRMTTPPKGPHRLLLPIPNADQFRQAMLEPGRARRAGQGARRRGRAAARGPSRVKRGETLSADRAQAMACRWAALRDANDLDGSMIHPGRVAADSQVGEGGTVTLASLAAPREDIAAQLPEQQGAQGPRRGRACTSSSPATRSGASPAVMA